MSLSERRDSAATPADFIIISGAAAAIPPVPAALGLLSCSRALSQARLVAPGLSLQDHGAERAIYLGRWAEETGKTLEREREWAQAGLAFDLPYWNKLHRDE
jgi:hypothetical protein